MSNHYEPLTKQELLERQDLEALEAELWYEIKFPDPDNIYLAHMMSSHKVVLNKVFELNKRLHYTSNMKIHCPNTIIQEIDKYRAKVAPPNDGKSYTCLYICCNYCPSKCIYVVPEEIICYQNYLEVIKKNFPNFDFKREFAWRMWCIVRKEALKRAISNMSKNIYN